TATTVYYWHISATGTAGTSAYSAATLFTTGVGIDAVDNPGGIPKQFALYQNYPNPFNPSTTIRFDLKEPSVVALSIYDVLGQKVVEETCGKMSAGSYEKSVNMEGLSSGVYLYRIDITGNDGERFTAGKKLLLLK
ncbi:MAG TPA: T9SS type A sorting domain-containing protein, partial [Candidatus Acidoferrales bacterium]|nr:T9SS type A sorting domain-containing protein [Candidatus Acidoferrales bacterium]